MIAKWIAQALINGQDHLLLDKEQLAQWHLNGAGFAFGCPWNTIGGPYARAAAGNVRLLLLAQLRMLKPSEWPTGMLMVKSLYGSRFQLRFPSLECEPVGEALWKVPLLARDPAHALDASKFDLYLTPAELQALQPLANTLCKHCLIRSETPILRDGLPWGPQRVELALIGGHTEDDIARWFSLEGGHDVGPPRTVQELSSPSYQTEKAAYDLVVFNELKAQALKSRTFPPYGSLPLRTGAPILKAGPYVQELYVGKAGRDSFHLVFLSTMANAKRPTERRKNFEINLQREELTKLKEVIDKALA